MEFNAYIHVKNQLLRDAKEYPIVGEGYNVTRRMTPAQLRRTIIDLSNDGKLNQSVADESCAAAALVEDVWVDQERPFYNVWPVVVDLSTKLRLDLPFSSITPPFRSMLLRFARGREPSGVCTAMMYWHEEMVLCHAYVDGHRTRVEINYVFADNEQVETWVTRARKEEEGFGDLAEALIRILVFVCLLANGKDIITPVVLSKDRARYESESDGQARQWLEERAARKLGRGFDVGRTLEGQRVSSSHWRNPHPALYWTGPGAQLPTVIIRAGAIVHRASMSDVPTGYLGPESEADDVVLSTRTPRESISAGRRFRILQRDGFRCQLCGALQADGVKLEVDHKVPLARGGSNDDSNLWTICERCNKGKSDKSL